MSHHRPLPPSHHLRAAGNEYRRKEDLSPRLARAALAWLLYLASLDIDTPPPIGTSLSWELLGVLRNFFLFAVMSEWAAQHAWVGVMRERAAQHAWGRAVRCDLDVGMLAR